MGVFLQWEPFWFFMVYLIGNMGNPNKILDSLLVISYRTGDKKALGLLVKRWNKKLCAQAYSYTKDWELAKDVTQDTWQVIMTKIHFLKDTNRFGSWALTIVSRKALDSIKKRQRFTSYDHKMATNWKNDSDGEQINENVVQQVLKAISNLPMDQQATLRLFYLEEYSLKEISEITRVSVNTVKTRLFRAREKMKAIIKR